MEVSEVTQSCRRMARFHCHRFYEIQNRCNDLHNLSSVEPGCSVTRFLISRQR